ASAGLAGLGGLPGGGGHRGGLDPLLGLFRRLHRQPGRRALLYRGRAGPLPPPGRGPARLAGGAAWGPCGGGGGGPALVLAAGGVMAALLWFARGLSLPLLALAVAGTTGCYFGLCVMLGALPWSEAQRFFKAFAGKARTQVVARSGDRATTTGTAVVVARSGD